MLNSQSVLRNDVTLYALARWVWDWFWVEFIFIVFGPGVPNNEWSGDHRFVHSLLKGDAPMRRQHSTGVTDSYDTRNRWVTMHLLLSNLADISCHIKVPRFQWCLRNEFRIILQFGLVMFCIFTLWRKWECEVVLMSLKKWTKLLNFCIYV